MLRLLLDEHMDPEIAIQIQEHHPDISIISLHTWEERRYLRTDDAVILTEAYRQGLTLITYDTRTIVPLLKAWGERGISHGGIIFVKSSTIAPDNVGGLINALTQLWRQYGDNDWANATIYLTP